MCKRLRGNDLRDAANLSFIFQLKLVFLPDYKNEIMAEKKPTETPMMKQFFAMKAQHPNRTAL